MKCSNYENDSQTSNMSVSSSFSSSNGEQRPGNKEVADLASDTKIYLKINNNSGKNSNVNSDDDETAEPVNEKIALSIENLEQIRMKAASMSLPLLTALCSDKDLIQSLKSSNQEDSYF